MNTVVCVQQPISAPMVLINLSNLDWVPLRRRRNQAIFSHLLLDSNCFAEGFYIQPPIVSHSRAIDYVRAPQLRVVAKTSECGAPVTVLQPVFTFPCNYRSASIAKLTTHLIETQLRREFLKERRYVLWVNSIGQLSVDLAERLAPAASYRVFDSSDDFLMYQRHDLQGQLRQQVRALEHSDRVLCVNHHVAGKINHPRKLVFTNCTEYGTLQGHDPLFRLEPFFPKPPGAVYIGFVGMMAGDRFDVPLLEAVMRRFPSFHFLFVGNTNKPEMLEDLKRHANFHFIEEVPHGDLASIIRAFDVAIVPHLKNEYTRGNDLLKILDYFACGVPVVSTPASNAGRYGHALYLAESALAFGNRIERLVSGLQRHNPAPGLAIARERSWENKVPGLVPWIFGQDDANTGTGSEPLLRHAAAG